jgi:hypothetical protein
MNNYNLDGKEFIQGIFREGQSFGEPPLFADVKYPANAEAILDSEVLLASQIPVPGASYLSSGCASQNDPNPCQKTIL